MLPMTSNSVRKRIGRLSKYYEGWGTNIKPFFVDLLVTDQ